MVNYPGSRRMTFSYFFYHCAAGIYEAYKKWFKNLDFIVVKILITHFASVRSQQVLTENTIYEDIKLLFYAEKKVSRAMLQD